MLREEVAARRLQLSSIQRAVVLLEERLERLGGDKQSWRRLAELRARGVSAENIAEWSVGSGSLVIPCRQVSSAAAASPSARCARPS